MRRPKETGVGEIRTYDVIPFMPDTPMDSEEFKKALEDVYNNPWPVVDVSDQNVPKPENKGEWPLYDPNMATTSHAAEYTVETPPDVSWPEPILVERWIPSIEEAVVEIMYTEEAFSDFMSRIARADEIRIAAIRAGRQERLKERMARQAAYTALHQQPE